MYYYVICKVLFNLEIKRAHTIKFLKLNLTVFHVYIYAYLGNVVICMGGGGASNYHFFFIFIPFLSPFVVKG